MINKRIKILLMTTTMFLSSISFTGIVSGGTNNVDTDILIQNDENIDSFVFNDDFESGKMSWFSRGSETVEVSTEEAHSGTQSLYISNRTEYWNGAECNKTSVLNIGDTYKFGAWVKYTGNSYASTHDFNLNLHYIRDGVNKYEIMSTTTVFKGEWTYIEGIYVIPYDASNVNVYVESAYGTPDNALVDFYLDDVTAQPWVQNIETDIPSLKDVYDDYFKIGCATLESKLESSTMQELIKKHYNSITCENELKPESILDREATLEYMNANNGDQTNPQISLASAKYILEFAQENNIPLRGHVLVWHMQTPDWFFKENYDEDAEWVSKEIMIERLRNYIKNVMEALETQYPEVEFYAWDVVNEAYTDSGTMRQAGSDNIVTGQSAWVQVFGDDSFIDYAFQFAREYAPEGCKLYYNDYNEYVVSKMNAIINKAMELKEKGLIDGIGMQSHLSMNYPSVSLYKQALEAYTSTGLEVQITELDITQSDTSEIGIEAQATKYKEIFDAIRDVRLNGGNITAVVFWGTTDASSWRSDQIPLIFDSDYKAKPAFYSIIENVEDISIEYEIGDVNQDSLVDISDLILLKKMILGIENNDYESSDVDGNGKVNAFDLVKLRKILLNI